MAYDDTNKKLYVDETSDKGGIATWQIYKCLRYNKRDKNGNMNISLPIQFGDINMFSRHKPFPHPAPNFDTKEEKHAAERIANYGITIPDYAFGQNKLMEMAQAIYAGEVKWEYHRPKGLHATDPNANEWFRYDDFDGYYHLAKAPIHAITTSEEHNTPYETFGLVGLFKVIPPEDQYQLSLEDLHPSVGMGGEDASFRNFYLGMCAWEVGTNNVYHNMSKVTYGEYLDSLQNDEIGDGLGVTVPTSYTAKTYMVFPYFQGSLDSSATMWPVPLAQTFITVKRDQQMERFVATYIDAYLYQGTYNPLYYSARIWNNTESAFGGSGYTYQIWSIDYNGDWKILLKQADLPSIAAGETYYIPAINGGTMDWGGERHQNTAYLRVMVFYNNNLVDSVRMYDGYINPDVVAGDEPFKP